MKLGLYGGAFNPIHRCHLAVAAHVRDRLGLDRVLFIPTGDAPHKPADDFMPAAHRAEMVRLAIAPFPHFQLSEVELGRPAKSYSIHTVRQLRAALPPDTRLIFIVGLDAFLHFPAWKEPDRLLETCDFAVVSRPGAQFQSLAALSLPVLTDHAALAELDRGETDLHEFRLAGGRSLWALAMPPCDVSAHDIRDRLTRGRTLENLLPPAVESYILKHHLMGGPSK